MKTVYLNKAIRKNDYDFEKGHEFELKQVKKYLTYVRDKLTDFTYWLSSEDLQYEPVSKEPETFAIPVLFTGKLAGGYTKAEQVLDFINDVFKNNLVDTETDPSFIPLETIPVTLYAEDYSFDQDWSAECTRLGVNPESTEISLRVIAAEGDAPEPTPLTLETATDLLKEAAELIGNNYSSIDGSDPVRLKQIWKKINKALNR